MTVFMEVLLMIGHVGYPGLILLVGVIAIIVFLIRFSLNRKDR